MVITNEVMYVFMLQLLHVIQHNMHKARGNIAINLLSIVQIDDQLGVCSIRVF